MSVPYRVCYILPTLACGAQEHAGQAVLDDLIQLVRRAVPRDRPLRRRLHDVRQHLLQALGQHIRRQGRKRVHQLRVPRLVPRQTVDRLIDPAGVRVIRWVSAEQLFRHILRRRVRATDTELLLDAVALFPRLLHAAAETARHHRQHGTSARQQPEADVRAHLRHGDARVDAKPPQPVQPLLRPFDVRRAACLELAAELEAGSVAFLSAYPTDLATLVLDIVTVHHREYYLRTKDEEGKNLLHPVAFDDEQPVPNCFPAVEKGAEFRFAVVPTARATEGDMALAEKALVAAITFHGVGAKTAAGYGWFDYDATDYAAVEPDSAKLAEWETALPSATKQKKEFVKLPEIVNGEEDMTLMRTAVAFIVSKPWWQSEKKNAGSKTTQFVKKWDAKFHLGEF